MTLFYHYDARLALLFQEEHFILRKQEYLLIQVPPIYLREIRLTSSFFIITLLRNLQISLEFILLNYSYLLAFRMVNGQTLQRTYPQLPIAALQHYFV